MNLVTILVALVIIGVIFCYRVKRTRKAMASEMRVTAIPLSENHVWEPDAPTLEKLFIELAQDQPVRFTPQQLCFFTENYKTELGSGGFGKVYKGQFPNGVKIAVKVLHRGPYENIEEQFVAEVGTIARTRHTNLVRLYGFCYDKYKSTLVFEFMENGSLDKHLFTKTKDLPWEKRNEIAVGTAKGHLFSITKDLAWEKLNEIAVGTAKGLAYLHEECQKRILHYDINPGNVLLDADFSPKVADYGVAMLCKRDETHVIYTGRRDTRPYLAPELVHRTYPISVSYKCDIYSFGILLFEIAGRRKNKRMWNDWFPKKVWEEYEKGELRKLIEDCGIEEEYRGKAERMAMVALWCVQSSPESRPPMSHVVKMLEGRMEIEPPPMPLCCSG